MIEHAPVFKAPRYHDFVAKQIKMANWHEPLDQAPYIHDRINPTNWHILAQVSVNCSTLPFLQDAHANYRKFVEIFTSQAVKRRSINASSQTTDLCSLRNSTDEKLDIAVDPVNSAKAIAIVNGSHRFYGEIRKLEAPDTLTAVQIVYGDFLSSRSIAALGGMVTGMVLIKTPIAEHLESAFRS